MANTAEPQFDKTVQAPPIRGFWATTWDHKTEIWNWDLLSALALTIGAHFAVMGKPLSATLPTLLVAEFGVAAALLGLVIAGVAVIVAFMSPEHAKVMARTEEGAAGEFWAFWYVAALAAGAIIVIGASLLLIDEHPHLTRLAFEITTFLTSYVLLASVNLVGFVGVQGETRAWQLAQRRSDKTHEEQTAQGEAPETA
jgi:hypothetical protein